MFEIPCVTCGTAAAVSADDCTFEVDERFAAATVTLLNGGPPSLCCAACGVALGCVPAVLVWTDRGARAHLCEGGPWPDGFRAADAWQRLGDVELVRYDDLASLREAIEQRYVAWLGVLLEAAAQRDDEASVAWLDEHLLPLGPELHAAAALAGA